MSRKCISFPHFCIFCQINQLKYPDMSEQAFKILLHSITYIETNTINWLVFFCRKNIGRKNLLIYDFLKTMLKCPKNAEFCQLQGKSQTPVTQNQAHPLIWWNWTHFQMLLETTGVFYDCTNQKHLQKGSKSCVLFFCITAKTTTFKN